MKLSSDNVTRWTPIDDNVVETKKILFLIFWNTQKHATKSYKSGDTELNVAYRIKPYRLCSRLIYPKCWDIRLPNNIISTGTENICEISYVGYTTNTRHTLLVNYIIISLINTEGSSSNKKYQHPACVLSNDF